MVHYIVKRVKTFKEIPLAKIFACSVQCWGQQLQYFKTDVQVIFFHVIIDYLNDHLVE